MLVYASNTKRIGCEQYMLLSNTPPFHGATEDESIERIFEAKVTFTEPVWTNVSPEAKALIKKLLTVSFHTWWSRHC